jgi:hypothetical protein
MVAKLRVRRCSRSAGMENNQRAVRASKAAFNTRTLPNPAEIDGLCLGSRQQSAASRR